MTFDMQWIDQEETVLLTTLHEGWDWPEFLTESSMQERIKLDEAGHPVYLLKRLEGRAPVPTLGWMQTFEEAGLLTHPHLEALFIITQTEVVKSLSSVYARFHPEFNQKAFVVGNLDEAWSMISMLQNAEAPLLVNHKADS